jgi:hypothetical protein
VGNSYSDGEAGESRGENLHLVFAVGDILKPDSSISGGGGSAQGGSVVAEQRYLGLGDGCGLGINDLDFEISS